MAMTQMNIRIDSDLKASGDSVLKRSGIAPSEVIRALWSDMANTGRVPDFLKPERRNLPSKQLAYERSVEGAGLARSLATEAGVFAQIDAESYDELREAAFEEQMVEEKERRQGRRPYA